MYFEKILKGSRTTLWMRNIQMGDVLLFFGAQNSQEVQFYFIGLGVGSVVIGFLGVFFSGVSIFLVHRNLSINVRHRTEFKCKKKDFSMGIMESF